MKYLIPLSLPALVLLSAGCATPKPKPYTIQGHPIHDIVLVAKAPAASDVVQLPAGIYYPGFYNNGFGFGNTYNMVYVHPAGIKTRDLIGSWKDTVGGIMIDFDPETDPPRVYTLTSNGGGSAPIPDGFKFAVVKRGAAEQSGDAAMVQRKADSAMQDAAVRAAVQGALATPVRRR
jgi:hypothetical protein